jgi:hypothetical protein
MYVIELEGYWFAIHESEILGTELTDSEKLKNLEGHVTKVLLDLQKCIKENQKLREENKILATKCAYCTR